MVCSIHSSLKRCNPCKRVHSRNKSEKSYYKHHPEAKERMKIRIKRKLQTDHQYRIWNSAKRRALSSGIAFSIDKNDIVIPEVCPVLLVPFKYKTYYTMSLDRIDSTKGYIKGNIQVISHLANAMKNSATPEELLKFADWVYKEYKNKKESSSTQDRKEVCQE